MNELKKLFGERITLLLILALLIVNGAFTLYTVFSKKTENEAILREAEKVVLEDEEAARAEYEGLAKQTEDYRKAYKEWKKTHFGDPPDPVIIPHTYDDLYDDYDFFDCYYDAIVTSADRAREVKNLLALTKKQQQSLSASGYDSDAYAARRLESYIEVYESVDTTTADSGRLVWGWDSFFSYEGAGLFAVAAGILLGCRLYGCERRAGMWGVVRATRRGRARLAGRKILFAALCSLCFSALFYGASLVCVAASKGLSSPFAPLWQVDGFLLCPYAVTIFEGALLRLLLTSLSVFFFAMLAALFETLTGSAIPAFFLSLALFGGEYGALQSSGFFSTFNALSPLLFGSFFTEWHDVNLFSHSLPALLFCIPTAIFCLLFAALSVLFWSKRAQTNKDRFRLKRAFRGVRTTNLTYHEARKVFRGRALLLLVALLIVKIVLDIWLYDGSLGFYDRRKQMYMEEFSGLSVAEQYQRVEERLSDYENLLSDEKMKEMGVARQNKTITGEEYEQFLRDRSFASSHLNTLKSYFSDLTYLVKKEAQYGAETKVVFDKGFSVLFENDFDVILFVCLLLFWSGVGAIEYETKFRPILRCSRNGRAQVFRRKLLITLSVSALFAAISYGIDLLFVFGNYDMSLLGEQLYFSARFSATPPGVTFGGYLVIVGALRVFGFTLLGTILFALSELTESTLLTALCGAGLLIPYLLRRLSVSVPVFFDLSRLLSGDQLWLAATEQGNATLLPLLAAPLLVLACVLFAFSARKSLK